MTTDAGATGNALRQVAIGNIRKKREFAQHLAVYVVVNLVLSLKLNQQEKSDLVAFMRQL